VLLNLNAKEIEILKILTNYKRISEFDINKNKQVDLTNLENKGIVIRKIFNYDTELRTHLSHTYWMLREGVEEKNGQYFKRELGI
jgi:hypothetical protein